MKNRLIYLGKYVGMIAAYLFLAVISIGTFWLWPIIWVITGKDVSKLMFGFLSSYYSDEKIASWSKLLNK